MFTLRMLGEEWRNRLAQSVKSAIADSDKSVRSISLEAGCSAGYLHGILNSSKEPGIDRLVRICAAVPVSLSYILLGLELSPSEEETIKLLADLPEEQRTSLKSFLRTMKAGISQT